ncbi:MAG: nuclear transport factor 2 family protein [Dehalococcoidia bacterium]
MQQAPELKDVVMRVYDAASRGDGDLMEDLTSHDDALVFIGTDPNEWFEDIAGVRRMLEAQAGAGVIVIPGDLRAYREGAVGWVADRGRFKLPDGSEVPFRMTGVFHQENGAWKLIQEHASFGVSNQEAIGEDLTG